MANTELILWAEVLDLYGLLNPVLPKRDNWPFLTNAADGDLQVSKGPSQGEDTEEA